MKCSQKKNKILYLKSRTETERRNSLHSPGIYDTRKDYNGIIPICHADFVSGFKKEVLALNERICKDK